jgi:uncharacterized protein YjbI with pentapeptide repeats
LSTIDWPSPEAFGTWLAHLQGQRAVSETPVGLHCLNHLNLDNCNLLNQNLAGASLAGASLDRTRLAGASLDRTRLAGASLDWARLDGARLKDISWNEKTNWANVTGWATAHDVPEKLKQQLGLM